MWDSHFLCVLEKVPVGLLESLLRTRPCFSTLTEKKH